MIFSTLHPARLILPLWIAWLVSWLAAGLWSNRTESRPAIGSEIRYRIPMLIGVLLMFAPVREEGPLRLWHMGPTGAWLCVTAVASGIGFAWWARVHLGRLWSGRITRKTDHRVVDSGPYAIVRHPIYCGLLLSLIGSALAEGTAPAIGGFFSLLLGMWMKARQEEHWLAQQLDAGAYADYCRRVPMLVPFLGHK
ncbi:MAG: methyltransferase family protein [Steroidobacteraceae bacterium]